MPVILFIMNQQQQNMINSPFVQAPLFEDVRELLAEVSFSDTYRQRGSGEQKRRLETVGHEFRAWASGIVDLSEFGYCYLTNGVTDAINQFSATTPLYQRLHGDYHWIDRVRQGPVVEAHELDHRRTLYFSNPQCYNGNFADVELIDEIDRAGCPVVVDCAYLGATPTVRMRLPERTQQVWFGFSKGWGLIGQRLGLCFTKEEHVSLNPMLNVECFDYAKTEIIHRIISQYSIDSQHARMHSEQQRVCAEWNLSASDTFFIANSTDPVYAERRRLGDSARLCITELLKVPSNQ